MTTPSKPVEETPFLADPSTEMTGAREGSPPPPTPPLPPPVGVDDSQDAEHQQHQKNDVRSYYFFPLYRLINGIKMMLLNVTLEPMLFVKMLAESNLGVVADTLEIDRVCRVNLNFSEDDCQNMDDGNHTDVQIDLVVQAGVCIVLVFFLLYLRSIFKRQPPPNHTL